VSGGETTIKQLYKEKYTAKIMCKVVVGCNAIPPTNDQSNATYRRMLIVPFNAVFSTSLGNINKNIVSEISKELPGVLNRVLKAYDELFARGEFFTPRVSMRALEAYRKDNDIIGSFFEDTYVAEEKCITYLGDIMEAYQAWRRINNVRADYDSRQIGKRIKVIFPRSAMGKDAKGRFYTGIRRITSEDKF
jgi:putative DNA primase/helicase